MIALVAGSPHEKALLPEGRMSGPMPWVIAIMIFLTVLAAAAGLSLTRAAGSIGHAIAGRVTIQILDANVERRSQQVRAIAQRLGATPQVTRVQPVDDAEIAATMEEWLGKDAEALGLPMPALIDVDLARDASPAALDRLRAAVLPVAPHARIEPHASWLGPVSGIIRSFAWIAAALVLLLGFAASAIVMLTARSALNIHHATIEVLHLIGATDTQIARLFQRRIALDALFGSVAGFAAAVAILFLLSSQFQSLGAALLADAALGWRWLLLPLIPLALVLLASVTARYTITRALKRIL
ncbi:cell division protein [Pseudonocardia sp. TMWB2A]|uniref:cell division protein FtsX n=1 Tax=Pseudonocardia sp. TMWB2A TaxID=687430 RepID=UPI00307D25DD